MLHLAIALGGVGSSLSDAGAAAFEFDTSRLDTVPVATLPAMRMKMEAFTTPNVLHSFVTAQEKPESSVRIGASRIADFTTNWRVERDPLEGSLLIARRGQSAGKAVQIDDEKVNKLSLELLAQFGVASEEVGSVVTKHLVARDLETKATEPSRATLLRYKTFITREINGTPVEGHRAVISHVPDGSFYRANLLWPATAPEGHKLRTRLTTPEITKRAEVALTKEGETTGAVLLRWKYLPIKQKTGEVTLELVVEARIKPVGGQATELREINVPIDAY